MKTLSATIFILLAVAAIAIAVVGHERFFRADTWQRLTSPGKLSKAHASLENDCASCHASGKGVEAAKCIVCHANNQSLLQRQPTSFHADISSCRECHLEHRGRAQRPTDMDHAVLARLGLHQLRNTPVDTESHQAAERLIAWLAQHDSAGQVQSAHPHISSKEMLLNCTACHSTKDKHFGLFGADCAQCHGTTAWTIPQFRHPSPTSRDCAQCHQAPPSHYMEHFRMISMMVARQPHARVEQCFLCHQTTSWNDIKGVGFYKHH